MAFDTLIQFMVTLAVGDGFDDQKLYHEVKSTFAFRELEPSEWNWIIAFITTGGDSLTAYNEFSKVEKEDGLWKVKSRQIAMRHRLHIGTIVSVRFKSQVPERWLCWYARRIIHFKNETWKQFHLSWQSPGVCHG